MQLTNEIMSFFQSKKHILAALICYTALAVLIFRALLISKGIIGLQIDWPIPPYSNQVLERATHIRYIWDPNVDTGYRFAGINDFGFWSFLGFFTLLGLGTDALSKCVSISLYVATAFFLFLYCRFLGLKFAPSFLAGLFFMLTPWIFGTTVIGYVTNLLGYALLPIFLIALEKVMGNGGNKITQFILLGVIFSLFLNANFVTFFGLVIFLYFLVDFIWCLQKNRILMYFKVSAFLGLSYFLINAFWILPLIITSLGIGSFILESPRAIYYKANIYTIDILSRPLVEVIRLVSIQSGGGFFYLIVAKNSLWIIASFVIAFIAFSAMLLRPRDRHVMFFSILALVSIFLSKGTSPPLGEIYVWLYKVFPYTSTDPYRHVALTAFAYAMLIGYAANDLSARISLCHIQVSVRRKRLAWLSRFKMKRIFLVIFIMITIALYSFPFSVDNFNNQLYTYYFSEDYEKLYRSFLMNPGDFRVLWLPTANTIRYRDIPNSQWAASNPLRHFAGKSSFSDVNPFYDPGFFLRWISVNFYQEKTVHLGKLIGLANVKYVINQYGVEGKGFPADTSVERLLYILKKQKGLQKFFNTSSYQIFYNVDVQPHIYPADEVIFTAGTRSVLNAIAYTDLPFKGCIFLFATQMSPNDTIASTSLVDTVLIPDGQLFDLVASTIPYEYVYEPGNYAAESRGYPWETWANLQAWFWDASIDSSDQAGEYLAALENSALTSANSSLFIPFSTSRTDTYYVWMKLSHGKEGSNIALAIDGTPLRTISSRSENNRGFLWRQISSVSLKEGAHIITLTNDGKGQNVVAKIVIAPRDVVERAFDATMKLLERKKIVMIYEFERQDLEFSAAWQTSKEFGVDVSQGEVLKSLSDMSSLRLPILIPRKGTYEFYVRVRGQPSYLNNLTLTLIGRNASFRIVGTDFEWHKIFQLPLEKQEYTLNITASNQLSLDQLLVTSSAPTTSDQLLAEISYQKINPTKYLVHVENARPFFLVFSESHDLNWLASAGGLQFNSYETNSFTNGFYINKTGKFDVLIEYDSQRYWDLGIVLSVVSLGFMAMALIIHPKIQTRYKRFSTRLDLKKGK